MTSWSWSTSATEVRNARSFSMPPWTPSISSLSGRLMARETSTTSTRHPMVVRPMVTPSRWYSELPVAKMESLENSPTTAQPVSS